MEGGHLVVHPHIDAEAFVKALGRLQGQLVLIGDDAADVIGQAAVGVGDKSRPLKNDDLRLLIPPADAGRGGRAAGNAADNDYFHVFTPPFRYRRKSRQYS